MVSLRDFTKNDIERLVTLLNNDEVSQFLSSKIPSPYTKCDATWWVNEGSKEGYVRAITYDDILIGCIGVNRGEFEYQRSGEIGFWLAQEYWRKGITKIAIKKLSEYVFTHTDIVRLFASVFSGNHASMQLLKKSGFKEEAIMLQAIYKNQQFYDEHIFSQLKTHWKAS